MNVEGVVEETWSKRSKEWDNQESNLGPLGSL